MNQDLFYGGVVLVALTVSISIPFFFVGVVVAMVVGAFFASWSWEAL